jgi:hypothetical protein
MHGMCILSFDRIVHVMSNCLSNLGCVYIGDCRVSTAVPSHYLAWWIRGQAPLGGWSETPESTLSMAWVLGEEALQATQTLAELGRCVK